jgi:hypothetical protein
VDIKMAMTKCSDAQKVTEIVATSTPDPTLADEFAGFVAAAYEKLASEGQDTTQAAVMVAAELMAINNGIVPPHWTGVHWCDRCNSYMPCETCESGLRVQACPWDHTEVGKIVRSATTTHEVPGSQTIRAWEIRNKASGNDNYAADEKEVA